MGRRKKKLAHEESMKKMGITTDRVVNTFSASDGETRTVWETVRGVWQSRNSSEQASRRERVNVAAGRMRPEPQREFLEFHRENVFLKREHNC